MTDPISIFIADDHPMIRTGLAALIAGEVDLRQVGEAANGLEAVQLIPALKPDLVLMDQMMPKLDGIAAIAQLHPRMPATRFLILTSLVEPGEIRRAIAAGAALPAEERVLAGAGVGDPQHPCRPPRDGPRGHRRDDRRRPAAPAGW